MRFRSLLPWLLAGGGLGTAGVWMALRLRGRAGTRLDRVVFRAILPRRGRVLTLGARVMGVLASPSGVLVEALVGSVLGRSRAARVRLFSGVALRVVVESLGKHVFFRPRPPARIQMGKKDGSSLPSGHALVVGTYLLFANAFLAGRRRADASAKRALGAVGVASTLGVLAGATRVYLGVHRATDVLAALLMGTGLATAVEGGTRFVEARARAGRTR